MRVRAGTEYDRDTGFVAEDNSGRSNIFPRKQQAYIKSSTSDAAAQQGLGGALGRSSAAITLCSCCQSCAQVPCLDVQMQQASNCL